ncbi:ABC-type molybdate transport system ATPase subunit [Bradyrhizobium elkanii]
MRRRCRTQMDLFLPLTQPSDMRGAERQRALALLRALLTEAATKPANEPQASSKKEAGNE